MDSAMIEVGVLMKIDMWWSIEGCRKKKIMDEKMNKMKVGWETNDCN